MKKHQTMVKNGTKTWNYEQYQCLPLNFIRYTGSDFQFTCFNNEQEKDDFIKDSTTIRDLIMNIHDEFYNGAIDKIEYKSRWKNEFVKGSNQFIKKWGHEMVPIDIRKAINDVEKIPLETITIWPEMNIITFINKYNTIEAKYQKTSFNQYISPS